MPHSNPSAETVDDSAALAAEDPRAVYERRLHAARAEESAGETRARRLANARLLAFLMLVGLGLWSLGNAPYAPGWLVLPGALFAMQVALYERAVKRRERASHLVAYYERGLARVADRWTGLGERGDRFRDPEHPYAEDLDLFGEGSLFQRVSTARTRPGEETLASWLLAPADVAEVRARQEAVRALVSRIDLREDLAVLGGQVGTEAAFEGLADWGAGPAQLGHHAGRWLAAALAIPSIPLLAAWLLGDWPAYPFLCWAALETAVGGWYLLRVRRVIGQVQKHAKSLGLLRTLLARLERECFTATKLRSIQTRIHTPGRSSAREIDRLARVVATLEARRNPLVAPFSPLLMWATQVAFAVEAWRSRSGAAIGDWLQAIGEMEALVSLAAFAFENPGDCFPVIVQEEGARYHATGLAHPLLPKANAVRNDVELGTPGGVQALLVSGSNMSGKSTLLRAVGTSVVLAWAGGTVRAHALGLTPLRLGATLRIQDSLQAGRSRFYTEILRLRRLLEVASERPHLLFLLDEVLAGTNSHDRRIGAEAILLGLIERGAIGLVTTHDLTLAEIAEKRGDAVRNVHFADQIEGGRLVFDYRMRPGVVRNSNALALMRSVGLSV